MRKPCAWCGIAVETEHRAGRPGKRVFCCEPHKIAFAKQARAIGADVLDASAKPAKDWGSNSQGPST